MKELFGETTITGDMGVAEFQHNNCKDCFFAEAKKVGTGEPCCTYPSKLIADSGKCQVKRQGKPGA